MLLWYDAADDSVGRSLSSAVWKKEEPMDDPVDVGPATRFIVEVSQHPQRYKVRELYGAYDKLFPGARPITLFTSPSAAVDFWNTIQCAATRLIMFFLDGRPNISDLYCEQTDGTVSYYYLESDREGRPIAIYSSEDAMPVWRDY